MDERDYKALNKSLKNEPDKTFNGLYPLTEVKEAFLKVRSGGVLILSPPDKMDTFVAFDDHLRL